MPFLFIDSGTPEPDVPPDPPPPPAPISSTRSTLVDAPSVKLPELVNSVVFDVVEEPTPERPESPVFASIAISDLLPLRQDTLRG